MSGRAEGYYGPSPDDLGKGCVLPAFAVVGVILIAALTVISFQEAGEPGEAAASQAEQVEAEPADPEHRSDIAIDVTDSQAMHGAGLPTKADVLAWHMYGRWGFAPSRTAYTPCTSGRTCPARLGCGTRSTGWTTPTRRSGFDERGLTWRGF